LCNLALMKDIVSSFGEQVKEAIAIAQKASLKYSGRKIENVIVCGLGGSGIGGKIVGQLFAGELKVPFSTANDYNAPAFVGPATLAIASSYSGNTEETISAINKCYAAGAEICVITSGGELKKAAIANGWNFVLIPGGEQPRAMLVYSIIQLSNLLVKYGLVHPKRFEEFLTVADFLAHCEAETQTTAMQMATSIGDKIPVIYSSADNEAICIRFRQQLNENSKILCWHHVLPEMTHNELVGWGGGDERLCVVYLSSPDDYIRTQKRWEFCKGVIEGKTKNIVEIVAKGNSPIERMMYLIHLTDWASLFLADIKKVDPVEVDVIGRLKGKMGQLK
jgi:glucose/mannose-6-phosphate isomerase